MVQATQENAIQRSALRKVGRRVLPILLVGYFISYLDRINISFAKFGLEETFGMTAAGYGLAAGIFFIGYVLFEVPSNMAMRRVGARIWLSRIMVTWGIVAAGLGFVQSEEWVYVLRFLLGAAEAGFFPGVILYLTYWYPASHHAKVISTLMMAIPVSAALGGPVNGWILDTMEGALGLEGWRWVFIIGGVPALVLGVVFFVVVKDRPSDARWLTPEERTWLTETIEAEERGRSTSSPTGHLSALKDRKVLLLSLIYFLLQCGAYPLTYWMPSVIKDVGAGLTSTQLGLLTSVPFVFSAITMYLAGRYVRRQDSAVPVSVALAVSVVAFAATATSLTLPLLAFAMITIATMAAQTAKPMFWPLSTLYLSGAAAAVGIALINSLGNLAGFVSPYAFGWIVDATGGDNSVAMTLMMVTNLLAIVVVVLLVRARRRKGDPSPAPSRT